MMQLRSKYSYVLLNWRRHIWVLPIVMLLALGVVAPLLIPFPDQHIQTQTSVLLPALFLIYNYSDYFLAFLLAALVFIGWQYLYSSPSRSGNKWIRRRMGCMLMLPIFGSCLLWLNIAIRGNLEVIDSFQGSSLSYKLVSIDAAIGLDADHLEIQRMTYFVLYECQNSSLLCRFTYLAQNPYGSDYPFFAHLEYDVASGRLNLLSNDEVVFAEDNVAPPESLRIAPTARITSDNAQDVREIARLIRPRISAAYWLPDGGKFLVSQRPSSQNSQDSGLWYYSLDALESPHFVGFQEPIAPSYWSFAFNADKSLYATVGEDSVYVWETATGKRIARLEGADKNSAIAFSPISHLIAYASDTGSVVKLYDLATMQAVTQLKGTARPIYDIELLAFSPDGKSVATAGLTGLRIWNLSDGIEHKLDAISYDSYTNAIGFSPDGSNLSVVKFSIDQWDVRTGQKLRSIGGYTEDGRSMAFSPDGSMIADVGNSQNIDLWDVKSGKRIAVLKGIKGDIFSIEFSPDGKLLLSASGDGLVRLWAVN